MNLKFFLPIRTGTLERERNRIARLRGYHLRRVMRLDDQIAVLQAQRNQHFAATTAFTDAEFAIDNMGAAMQIDHHPAE